MRGALNERPCGCTAGAQNPGRGYLGLTVTLWVLLVCLLAGTALAGKGDAPVRIGVLTVSWGPPPKVMGLIDGLVALGYRENEDFVIGVRFTRGDISVLPAVARELVRDGVDILFCLGEPEAKAAQQATTTHPIVFGAVGDPVGLGLIQSYARPGGNITGVTDLNLELSAKRLELFQALLPALKRVLYPYHADNPYQATILQQYRAAAHRLGIVLVEQPLRTLEEARDTLAGARKADIDGLLAPRDVDLNIPGFVLDAAIRHGIPSMFDAAFYLQHGGLASYGPSFYSTGRQAARLVDKLIKGVLPRDIPVEVDNYFELVINLKVASALGLTIHPEVLYQADRIIR